MPTISIKFEMSPKWPLYNHNHPKHPIAIGTIQGGITNARKRPLALMLLASNEAPIKPKTIFRPTDKNIQ